MSGLHAQPRTGSIDHRRGAAQPRGPRRLLGLIRLLGSRVATMCLVEMQKLRHDRTELLIRAIQPALWLLIFGEIFTRLRPSRPATFPTSTT